MKRFFLLLIIVVFVSSTLLKAQISRNEWTYGPVLQSDNFVYAQIAGPLIPLIPGIIKSAIDDSGEEGLAEFQQKNRWWYPSFRYRANVVQKLNYGGLKATLYPKAWGFSGWDWGFDNYSVGYHVGYLSRLQPFGFDVEADFAQDGYRMKLEGMDKKVKIVKRMVSAEALLKIRLLKYDTHSINPVVEIGGGYDYAFHYHDEWINDRNAVNNGFTGIIGIGFTNTLTHLSWSLRYEHSFYNFYNKDFIYDGEAIFKDSKSTFGRLGFALTYGF